MVAKLLGKLLYFLAQAAMPLGNLGAHVACALFARAQSLNPKLDKAQAWQYALEGAFARRRGDVHEAVRLLREASLVLPQNDILIANLGIALAASGEYEEAIGVIERAIRGEMDITGEPQVWVALAWSYLRSGRAPKAVDACDRAEESQASSPDVRAFRLLAQGVTRGFVQRDHLSQLLRLRPTVVPFVLEYVQHLVQTDSTDLARQVLRCLPKATQSSAFGLIARSAINEDQFATALWALKQLEIGSPASPEPPIMRAEVSLRQGDMNAALRHARLGTSRDARSARAHEQLVRVRLARGEWEEAISSATEALAHKGTDALAAGVKAISLLDDSKIEEARKLFMTQRSGDSLACAHGYSAQALVFAMSDQPHRAADVLERAVRHMAELPAWASGPVCAAKAREAARSTLERIAGIVDEDKLAELSDALARFDASPVEDPATDNA